MAKQEKSLESDQHALAMGKITAFIERLDPGYGEALVQQLINRMESTAGEFQFELEALLGRLKQNAATQEELLGRIRKRDAPEKDEGITIAEDDDETITEWEKRLAELEASSEQSAWRLTERKCNRKLST